MVCVAQLQHQIDVMPIIEVLKNNDKLHLTILGEDGTGERYNEVINYINIHHINNVEIIGKIERKEMVNYLENKDIGILPMITSSIPNKIFDYMAAMLPIIVLGDNDSSDFVVKNNIGWKCNFNSVDLNILLKSMKTTDIQSKKKQVVSIRDEFSRNILHKKIKNIIT
ncbi:MAG: glycosyltransferase [Flavobacteriales bacterium]|nr:glycosyltransferase [Flavobacteriales bacterium]